MIKQMNEELPKSIKRSLRMLAERAYEVELRRALMDLSRDFDRWKQGEIDSFELKERIHKFHDGPAKEIYLRYTSNADLRLLVAYAVRENLIEQESIPPEVLPYLEGAFAFYREVS